MIDGDILAFTVAARSETRIDWGDTGQTVSADLDAAKVEAERWVKELQTSLNADSVIVALSDPRRRYFRHEIYPEYKSHRTHGTTPLLLFDLKDHFRNIESFRPYERPNLEADDILGILGSHPSIVPGEKIIVTADKDLRQIAGKHFNPRKADLGIIEVTPEEADRYFWTQTLTGDPTDGFPGCPKIGPVKAKRILDAADEADYEWCLDGGERGEIIWQAIVDTYAAKGLDEAYALTQARVARILRHTDYDYANKRPVLWTPPSGD